MGLILKDKKPEDMFLDIFKKCEKLRIHPKEFSKLPAIKKLNSKKSFVRDGISFWCFAAFIAVFSLFFPIGPQTLINFLEMVWSHVHIIYIKYEKCIIDMPGGLQDLFRPPIDCTLCRNVRNVEKITNISPEEFENRYAYTNVPVIVSDGTANWTALNTFSFEFFRQLYMERDVYQGEWECQFFQYNTEFMTLNDALQMSPERAEDPWYFGWSNCDHKIGSILRKHYQRPYFLPLHSESTNVDWMFMGKPGYGAPMHIDHVHNPSWQAQIKGRKQWTLEPPPECYSECHTMEVVVNPGEVIVLDTNRWYHQTLIIGDDLSITIGSEYD